MKTATIYCEGGDKKGFGHLSRCLALADSLRLWDYSIRIEVDWDGGNHSLLAFDFVVQRRWVKEFNKNPHIFLEECKKNDVLVFDSYFYELNRVYNIAESNGCKKVFFCDEYPKYLPDDSIIIAPALEEDHQWTQVGKNLSILSGKQYLCLQKPFWRPLQRNLIHSFDHVLISIGANDIHCILPKLVQVAQKYTKSVTVISSSTSSTNSHVLKILRSEDALQTDVSAEEMLGALDTARCAIVGAGQTMIEALSRGLECFALIIADNQKLQLERYRPSASCSWDETQLEEKVGRFLKQNQTVEYSTDSSLEPLGAVRCATMIESMRSGLWLRSVVDSDCEEVYSLSNAPDVRAASIKTSAISWDEHKAWFKRQLTDVDSVFLIIEDRNNKEYNIAGQVRIKKIDTCIGLISLSVSSLYRGQGLAVSLIRVGSIMAARKLGLHKIVATIKHSNIASICAFIKAGYSEDHQINFNELSEAQLVHYSINTL